ncbi:terpenoid synthase [Coniochaeta ligniaria NRRL 30616]|uniref:Terpene synthase n=1 Tax=Coniochaeta ligniaria NRRL 30616 TaxID=1408157 RepID=A0A1J7ICH5_9PEZI|nr:terpenoid synthase [Coniochaeta ligniaria NRRL 30616]
MAHSIVLPNMLANWKWPRRINPHYDEVKQASAAWLAGFGAFSPKAQQAFDRCDFKHLRTGCDLMNLFFVIDEYTDVATESEAREMARIIMDAIYNPCRPRPEDEWVGGEIARQFWALASKTMGDTASKRFAASFDDYLNSVVTQAADRDTKRVRNIRSYLEVRRLTIGALPSYAIMEAGMDIPDAVMNLPVVMELTNVVTEMLCIGNVSPERTSDQVSYNKEQACGDEHNIVVIVMNQLNLDAQGALNWVAGYHAALENRFNTAYSSLPRFGGPLDLEFQSYVDGLGNWVRANDQWSFESARYFGSRGLEIMKTRTLNLLPKKTQQDQQAEFGPQAIDESLL